MKNLHFKEFCFCGKPIYEEKGCPKHGFNSPYGSVEKKQKIGKYSGFSKNEEWGRNKWH